MVGSLSWKSLHVDLTVSGWLWGCGVVCYQLITTMTTITKICLRPQVESWLSCSSLCHFAVMYWIEPWRTSLPDQSLTSGQVRMKLEKMLAGLGNKSTRWIIVIILFYLDLSWLVLCMMGTSQRNHHICSWTQH
ncbi:hypothetical protein V8F06_002654 [Rhypophila decipiens]